MARRMLPRVPAAARPKLPRLPTRGLVDIEPPRREATVKVGRRRIGIAEYGVADGPLVLWFHGTPGARRQLPSVGRRAARELGLRVVLVERPGIGASSQHRFKAVADVARDAATVADHLGHEQFAAIGLSGGGPYALACAAMLPERVPAVGVLGGVIPMVGEDAWTQGLIAMSAKFQPVLQPLREPLGIIFQALLYGIIPAGPWALDTFAKAMPAGDQKVFADPEIKAMFIDDLAEGIRGGMGALWHDAALFGAHWGFQLADVRAPVSWWHGDSDTFVSLEAAEHACERLADVTMHLRPGEGHLGAFAVADEVLAEVKAAAGWS